jgi:hypothetical protein
VASRYTECNIATAPAHFTKFELLQILHLEKEGRTLERMKCSSGGSGIFAGPNEQFNGTVTSAVVFPSALLPAE